MRATYLTTAAMAGILCLSACSQKTEDSTVATVNSAGNDIEAGTDNAVAAADGATANSSSDLDRAGDKIENAADDAARATGNALNKAGRAISNAADDARH